MRLMHRHGHLHPDLHGLLTAIPLRMDAKALHHAGGGVDALAPDTETVDGDETYVDPVTGLTTAATVDQMSIGGFDYSSRDKGGLFQLATENKLTDPRAFDPATTAWDVQVGSPVVTSNVEEGIDGTVVADKLEDIETGSNAGIKQFVTIPNDLTWWTVFCHVRKDNDESRFPELHLHLADGTLQRIKAQINTKTGAVATVSSIGTVRLYVVDMGAYWKFVLSVKNNNSGNTSAKVYLFPAAGTSLGGQSAAAIGSIIIDAAQLENHTFATTFTEGVRAASLFEYDNTNEGFARAPAGTWILAFTPQCEGTEPDNSYLIDTRDDSNTDGIALAISGSTGEVRFYVRSGGVTSAFFTGTTVFQRGVTHVIAVVWQDDEYRIYVDGIEENFQTTASKPAPTTLRNELKIGSGYPAYDEASGCIAYFLGYDHVITPARIAAATDWIRKRLGLS